MRIALALALSLAACSTSSRSRCDSSSACARDAGARDLARVDAADAGLDAARK